jgi:hypothetical protein
LSPKGRAVKVVLGIGLGGLNGGKSRPCSNFAAILLPATCSSFLCLERELSIPPMFDVGPAHDEDHT